MNFEVKIAAREPGLSNETTDPGYFSLAEMEELDMLLNHRTRIHDTHLEEVAAFIK